MYYSVQQRIPTGNSGSTWHTSRLARMRDSRSIARQTFVGRMNFVITTEAPVLAVSSLTWSANRAAGGRSCRIHVCRGANAGPLP
jgi:hypothetical protein